MWKDLPFDLLAKIFSFLSPDSLACARSTCRHWHGCAKNNPLSLNIPWFIALPLRNQHSFCCYAQNPIHPKWYLLSLDFLPSPVKSVASIESLLLLRSINSTILSLLICNPFTKQYKQLPRLNISRTNPAVGVIALDNSNPYLQLPSYKIYVAGGMSERPKGDGTYEPTLEMYDSGNDKWQIVGYLPVEFAVRLTFWTPNECVFSNGVLYWITSARAFSLMGYDILSNRWRELKVPMAEKLEFAALVLRNERLGLVGGINGGDGYVWEFSEGGIWSLVEKVPVELGKKFVGEQQSWANTKCVGGDGSICLHKDLGSGMIVWKKSGDKEKWEWFRIEGCDSIKGRKVSNLQIKGVLVRPNLALSSIF